MIKQDPAGCGARTIKIKELCDQKSKNLPRFRIISLFDCLRDGSAELEVLGRRSKIFQAIKCAGLMEREGDIFLNVVGFFIIIFIRNEIFLYHL